ncbi:MAG: hypothetical protein K0S21_2881 [Rhizobiaceae bacterium]|jgi:hypothetical protein|nr:hypothetical protein [Rhizobiaceae bacterium]
MEFFDAIEQIGPVRLLKASFYAYPIVNALHIAAIGALLTSVVLLDLRLLGAFAALPKAEFVSTFRRIAVLAFAVAALTGLTLFSVRASEYATMPVFLLKMGLIAAALANFLGFVALQRGRSDGEVTAAGLRAAALASIVLWSSVLLCGRFIGFV